jgi:hypothetical protein
MFEIKNFQEAKELFLNQKTPVVGIGVRAFERIMPGFFYPEYSVMAIFETSELPQVREKMPVWTIERDFGAWLPPKFNTLQIVKNILVQDWLKSLKRPKLWIYKSTSGVEKVCQKLGVEILAAPSDIRDPFEDKKAFRSLGEEAGLRMIPGENMRADDLDEKKFESFRKKYGPRLVFQLTDYDVGGGRGTFFVDSGDDFLEFKEFVLERRKKRELELVNVCRRIEGTPGSISACVTSYGVLCGLVQTQVMDVPALCNLEGRSGVWVGHDWSRRFSSKVQMKAESIAHRLGEFMAKKGYLGVFGIDLAIEEGGEVWPVECNSRFTGAFPMYSMMQIENNEMPMEVFHFLEFLRVPYEIDFEEVQNSYRAKKPAVSHLVMHNLLRKWVEVEGRVKSGIYRIEKKGIEWVRDGFTIFDIKDGEKELVLTNVEAREGALVKPCFRIGRLLFKRQVTEEAGNLLPEIEEVVKRIYAKFQLTLAPKPRG